MSVQTSMLKDSERSSKSSVREGDVLSLCRDLFDLIENHYERTGDPALQDIIARGKRVLNRSR